MKQINSFNFVRSDLNLAPFSYYKIGGRARYFAQPTNLADLMILRDFLQESHMPFFILGAGSNLLFDDLGFDGVIIHTKKLFPDLLELKGSTLRCAAGVTVAKALRFAAENGFGGLECLVGVPGSMGGVVAMNAGTAVGEIKSLFEGMEVFDLAGDVSEQTKTLSAKDTQFTYRKNLTLRPSQIILTLDLALKTGADPSTLQAQQTHLLQKRKSSQPIEKPSCGSVFKNPNAAQGFFAWKLIAEAGLRGHRIGDAQISELHTNFIINLGNASAEDVKALIQLAKDQVQKRSGYVLEEEVKVVPYRGTDSV